MEFTVSGVSVIVDEEDFEKIKDMQWRVFGDGYVGDTSFIKKSKPYKNKQILLHRFVMNAKENDIVDHINHNKLDNRKCNLRLGSQSQNLGNQRKIQVLSSKYKGVHKMNGRTNYRAQITCNYKYYNLGVFSNEKDAAIAYNAKATELFGEYACLNKIED